MSNRDSGRGLRDRRLAPSETVELYVYTRLGSELGRRVRELRGKRAWSQFQLAEAASMTQSAVARCEAGSTTLTVPVLERLASALGVELVVTLEEPGQEPLSAGS